MIAIAPASASPSVKVTWYASAVAKLTLTPNYATGYGTVKATFGTQPSPAPGTGACLQGCYVDFGTVQQSAQYLYKYAVHLKVVSNDTSGFRLYGEGAADFTDTSGDTLAVADLSYVPSFASGDTNTGYSAGLPFQRTSGSNTVNPATPSSSTAPTIAYASSGTYPSPIDISSAAIGDIYQDYELQVPATAVAASGYYAWIVYTVVPE